MAGSRLGLRQKTSSARDVVVISDDSDDNDSYIEVVSPTTPSKISNHFMSGDEDDDDDEVPVPFNPKRSHSFDDPDASPRSEFEARRRRVEHAARRLSIRSPSPVTEEDDNHADDEDELSGSDDLDAFIDDSEDDYGSYYGGYGSARSRKPRYNTAKTDARIIDNEDEDPPTRSRALLASLVNGDLRKTFRELIGQIETGEDLKKLYPASLHPSAITGSDATTNEAAVLDVLAPQRDIWGTEKLELDLDQFVIYEDVQLNANGKGTAGQLRSPFSPMNAIKKKCELLVDGFLQTVTGRQRVIGLRVMAWGSDKLMDPSVPSTEAEIFLETEESRDRQLRYRLKAPTIEYLETWEDFVWLADFSKYVFHYLWAEAEEQRRVSLSSFGKDFWTFITNAYNGPHSLAIRSWHSKCNRPTDFRKHVIRYARFLQTEAMDLDLDEYQRQVLAAHELWDDLGVPMTKNQAKNTGIEKTVVTPEVGAAFLEMFPLWGPDELDLFDMVSLVPQVEQARNARRRLLGFPTKDISTDFPDTNFPMVDNEIFPRATLALEAAKINPQRPTNAYQVLGSAIIVDRGQYSQFAYVRDLSTTSPNQVLVVWLELPSVAIGNIAKGLSFYPVGNELFFTDQCNCQPVRLRDIQATFQLDTFKPRSSSANGFFAHALYRTESKEVVIPDDPSEVLPRFGPACMQHNHFEPTELLPDLPPPSEVSKLKVQSLFSGCGLLDHSMASTEFIDTVFSIEINESAHLSHKANTANSCCRHVQGSVNEYLRDVCNGDEPYQDIDCTVAGCPCKGFSNLNAHKDKEGAHRNCTLLVNTLSWISVFLPRYVLIENVPNMNSSRNGGANACAQAICTLVSLGYQVTKMQFSGQGVNAASSRERLFIVAAAPGLKLPQDPTRFTTGQPTNAYEAILDLGFVENDTELNISRPDHIPFERLNVNFDVGVALRDVVRRVPMDGKHRNLYGAYEGDHLTIVQEEWFEGLTEEKQSKTSKSLQRVDADGFFPTITCSPVPLNSRGFACIHPFQDRVLTLDEMRRAQGIPDNFLLVGTPREAAEQIGNGVVWEVGVVWGLAIAQAAWASGLMKPKPREKRGGGKRKAIRRVEREERESSVEFLGERSLGERATKRARC